MAHSNKPIFKQLTLKHMSIVKFLEQAKDSQFLTPALLLKPVNHEGHLDVAFRLIDEAKEGGANAIKFQTYKASTIASKNSPSYWDLTRNQLHHNMIYFLNTTHSAKKNMKFLLNDARV